MKNLAAEGITSYGFHGNPQSPNTPPVHLSSTISEGPAGTVGRHLSVSIPASDLLRMLPGLARYAILATRPDLANRGYWSDKAVEAAITKAIEAGIASAIADASVAAEGGF